MKNKRRNIPDPISPQNPVHQTDRTDDRIREHLEDKTSLEEDIFRDETDLINGDEELRKRNRRSDTSPIPDDEPGV